MPRRPLRAATGPLVAATATLLLAGCGPESPEEERTAASAPAGARSSAPGTSPAPQASPLSLEELAEAVGCAEPKEMGKTLDYRQGVCETGGAEYVLLTFDTDQGQRDWLDISQMYGGVYLVGDRWVLSASPRSAMESARAELGGTIEESEGYGVSPSAG